MKLSKWAKEQGITYVTAYRWFCNGQIPNSKQMPTGTIIILPPNETLKSEKVVIYTRVSSYEKKDDLDRQVQRCETFCNNKGLIIEKVIKEIASGMNDNRPKLKKLISEKPTHIVIEHKDRLTRFGFHYFEQLLPMIGCKLTVINEDKEDENDLMKDLISIITSFCCRLYGLRRGQNKATKIKKELIDKSN